MESGQNLKGSHYLKILQKDKIYHQQMDNMSLQYLKRKLGEVKENVFCNNGWQMVNGKGDHLLSVEVKNSGNKLIMHNRILQQAKLRNCKMVYLEILNLSFLFL